MVSGANSAEGGREGLGVMTLQKKGIEIVMSLSSTEAPAGYPIKTVIIFPSPCLPTTQKGAQAKTFLRDGRQPEEKRHLEIQIC